MTDAFDIPRKPSADRSVMTLRLDREVVDELDAIVREWRAARRGRKIQRADVIRAMLQAAIRRLRA